MIHGTKYFHLEMLVCSITFVLFTIADRPSVTLDSQASYTHKLGLV